MFLYIDYTSAEYNELDAAVDVRNTKCPNFTSPLVDALKLSNLAVKLFQWRFSVIWHTPIGPASVESEGTSDRRTPSFPQNIALICKNMH